MKKIFKNLRIQILEDILSGFFTLLKFSNLFIFISNI